MIRLLIFTAILFISIFSCSDEQPIEPVEEEPIDLSIYDVSIEELIIPDTSSATISSVIVSERAHPFDQYGFILTDPIGSIDTMQVSQGSNISTFQLELSSLERNQEYGIQAYAGAQELGKIFSETASFYTKAFVLDSMTPDKALAEEFMILHGHGLQDFDTTSSLYLFTNIKQDSIRAFVKTAQPEFLILEYKDEPDNSLFEEMSVNWVRPVFDYRGFNYKLDNRTEIYTSKISIQSVEADTVKHYDPLIINGSFGNLHIDGVYVDGVKIPAVTDDGRGTVAYGWRSDRKEHKLVKLLIHFTPEVEPGTYTVTIESPGFTIDLPDKITIIED